MSNALENQIETVNVSFREAPAAGVDRQLAVRPLEAAVAHEILCFSGPAKAVLFQGQDHEWREGVVDLRDVHVARGDAGASEEIARAIHRGRLEELRLVIVRHHHALRPRALGAGKNVCRPLPEIASALGRSDDASEGTVGLEAAVEKAKGLGDEARPEIVLHRHRLAHQRAGVSLGMLAAGDRHGAEGFGRRLVLVQVAAGDHGDLVHGANEPEGEVELPVALDAVAGLRPGASSRAAVSRPPTNHYVCGPTGHRHGRVKDRRAAASPSVTDGAEIFQVLEAEVPSNVDFERRFDVESDEAVDVASREPGVVQGREDGLEGDLPFGPTDVLGKGGLADPGDSRLVLDPRLNQVIESDTARGTQLSQRSGEHDQRRDPCA